MPKFLKVDSVSVYEDSIGYKNLHPLVSVIPYASVTPIHNSLNQYGVYALFLLENNIEELNYGMGKYDYQAGTLITVAPGQIGGREDDGNAFEIKGWALLFHPDILRGTALENKMEQFSYFSYHINEALFMAEEERETLKCCFELLKDELENEDKINQDKIIVSLLEVILNYCLRFYSRQFTTRKIENSNVLTRFEQTLIEYYKSNKQLEQGIPSVKYCSEQLFLSTNYFGDLVKKETGNSPNHFIQQFIINRAKSELINHHSVSQTAYNLGFGSQQSFSRFFKAHTRQTPLEYIKQKN